MQNNWLNKINNHETPPTTEVWQHISNELDKENKKSLRIKMFAYETNFPAVAWQNIINRLYKDENLKQLYPEQRKMKLVYFRIAAAAAVIAIVLIIVVSNNKKITTNDVSVTTSKEKQNSLSKIKSNPVTALVPQQEKNNTQKKEFTSITPPSKTISVQPLQIITIEAIKDNEVQDLAQLPSMNNKEKLQNANGQIPMDIALINTPNNNISMTGANEQSVKASSKFTNLVNHSSNASPHIKENIDIIIEESSKWRPIIEAWRKKITDNSNTPSMNIIELGKMLEENK